MHNAYEARDPEGTGWRDEVGRRRNTPPADGPDQWLPPQVPGHDGEPDDPSRTARFDERPPRSPAASDALSDWPAPDSGMPRRLGRDDGLAGTEHVDPGGAHRPWSRGGRDDDLAGTQHLDPRGLPEPGFPDHTGHSSPPPGPASFDPQGAQRPRRDHGAAGTDAPDVRVPDRSRDHTGLSSPPPAPASFDPHGAPTSPDGSGDPGRRLGGHTGAAPDGPSGERLRDGDDAGGEPYVERAMPAGQQLRASVDRASSRVRRSVPLRTLLFLLPPLVLPPLAFDLSLVATLVVALLLLWIAAAAAVFCTMMLEGSQHLALREQSGEGAAVAADASLQEALMAIGAQLDRLDDRVTALGADGGDPAGTEALDDEVDVLSHRPQEHVPNTPRDEQYDRYGQTAVPDTNWGESRWRR